MTKKKNKNIFRRSYTLQKEKESVNILKCILGKVEKIFEGILGKTTNRRSGGGGCHSMEVCVEYEGSYKKEGLYQWQKMIKKKKMTNITITWIRKRRKILREIKKEK